MRMYYQGCASAIGGNREEQLATLQEFEDSREWIAEPKYDGIWCAIVRKNGKTTLYSRNHTSDKPQIKNDPDVERLWLPDDTILIGELGYGSQHAVGIREQLGHGFAWVYDCLAYGGALDPKSTRLERRAILDNALAEIYSHRINKAIGKPSLVLQRAPVFSKAFLQEYERQHEGLILKPKYDGAYLGGGKKVKHWWKVKKQHTADYVILDWEKSTAKTKADKNMAATLICGGWVPAEACGYEDIRDQKQILYKPYMLIPLVSVAGMDLETCKDVARNFKKYEGKVLEVNHFGMFDSGSCRHPSFVRLREDKASEECRFRE